MPSNIFLKRLRPSLWLSGLMLLWGIMMVRFPIVFLGLDTVSQWLYARLCKVWCTTMVACLVRARLSDHIILTPRLAMCWMLGATEAGLFPGVTYYLSWYASHCQFGFSHRHSTRLTFFSPLSTAGTSAPSTAFVLPSSFPLLPYPAHSADCSQYVVLSLAE